jgi:hypothetical protein
LAANATAIWRVRPSGSDNNGGGYDPGIASAGTDFSQQDAAQVTQSAGVVSTATTTLTDTGASFTSALIGNGIRVAGTGITTTYTFITAVPSGTTLTLQTSPGTTGTSVTYNIGGGWATFWTNTAPLVPGNIVYILGSGTPNPAAYTYDFTLPSGGMPAVNGNTTAGRIYFVNDPATPGYKAPPDTTGGMPVIKIANGNGFSAGGASFYSVFGLYLVSLIAGSGVFASQTNMTLFGTVIDFFGNDSWGTVNCPYLTTLGCEFFSSQGGTGTRSAIRTYIDATIINCNFHDLPGHGVHMTGNATINGSVLAKNVLNGLLMDQSQGTGNNDAQNNTIDGNAGHGIEIVDQGSVAYAVILNNIISNQVGAGKFGLTADVGTAAANTQVANFIDYNVYYNNTANYNAINASPHDTALGVDPYVASSTENYTLK